MPTCSESRLTPSTPTRSPHLRGLLMVGTGALCLVPDATLVRLASADDFEIVFWRSLLIGLSLLGVVALRHGTGTMRAFRAIGRPGMLVAGLWGVGLVLFVYSVNHTAVANTLVIVATAPFFAAVFTRLLTGEMIPSRTWRAMPVVVGGVFLTFAGGLHLGGTSGDLAAFGVAIALGLNLTLIRRAQGTDLLPALSIAGFAAAAMAGPAAWPVGITGRDLIVIAVMGFVLVPAAFTLFTLGAHHLPSPEVTLLMTLETVFGPLLAWAVLNEPLPHFALLGGTVIVTTLVVHSLAALRQQERTQLNRPTAVPSQQGPATTCLISCHSTSEGTVIWVRHPSGTLQARLRPHGTTRDRVVAEGHPAAKPKPPT